MAAEKLPYFFNLTLPTPFTAENCAKETGFFAAHVI